MSHDEREMMLDPTQDDLAEEVRRKRIAREEQEKAAAAEEAARMKAAFPAEKEIIQEVAAKATPRKKRRLAPHGDRLVLQPLPDSEFFGDGLLLKPDIAKTRPQCGLVIAHGPGTFAASGAWVPMEYKVGQTVAYGKYAGTEYDFGEGTYLIVRMEEIFGVISEVEGPNA